MYQVKNVGTSPPALWESWALVPLDDVIVTVHMSMRIFYSSLIVGFSSFLSAPYLARCSHLTFSFAFMSWNSWNSCSLVYLLSPLRIPNLYTYTMIQTQEFHCPVKENIDGDRWPCLLYRLFTSYVAAFTRNSGFWSIPIPSVRSIMYGRLSCLYISPKKTETQSLQYSTWHLWVRMISACFSSFETTWSMFFHDCHGLFCQVLTDKEAFQAQFFLRFRMLKEEVVVTIHIHSGLITRDLLIKPGWLYN